MKIKPKAGRVALTVPLEAEGPNYNEDAQAALKIDQLTLQSQPSQLTTTHALGVIRLSSFCISLLASQQATIGYLPLEL